MKNILLKIILIAALGGAGHAAANECTVPASPIIPDGNVASQDELVAAQQAIKTFQGELLEYRACIDGLQKALDPEADTTVAKKTALNALYDASVDAEDRVANEFNVAVRAFKARQ